MEQKIIKNQQDSSKITLKPGLEGVPVAHSSICDINGIKGDLKYRGYPIAELAAMICGFFIGLVTSVIPILRIEDYGIKLMVTTGITAIVWLIALVLTPPESDEVLEQFVRLVRPPGPGWKSLRKRFQIVPVDSLETLIIRFLLGIGVLFGFLFAVGGFLLHQERGGWIGLICAVLCLFAMKRNIFLRAFSLH